MLKFVPNHERLFQGVGGFKSGQESAYFFEMYAVVLGINLPNKGFLSPYRSDPGVLKARSREWKPGKLST